MFVKKIILYIIYLLKFQKNVKIVFGGYVDLHSKFEGMNKIHMGSSFRGEMGVGSYISHHSSISAYIGRFCSIGANVRTITGTHPYKYPFATTSPCFYSTDPILQSGKTFATHPIKFEQDIFFDKTKRIAVNIGNDVWIGDGVSIIGGLSISDGAMVLANAVVTKNVPPYAIVGGVPAKILGYRYDENTIDWLLKVKWWNNSMEWFDNRWEILNDIDQMKQELV